MERFVAAALAATTLVAKVRSVARKHLFRRGRSRLEHLPWRLEIQREKFLGLEHVSPCCGKVCNSPTGRQGATNSDIDFKGLFGENSAPNSPLGLSRGNKWGNKFVARPSEAARPHK